MSGCLLGKKERNGIGKKFEGNLRSKIFHFFKVTCNNFDHGPFNIYVWWEHLASYLFVIFFMLKQFSIFLNM